MNAQVVDLGVHDRWWWRLQLRTARSRSRPAGARPSDVCGDGWATW